MTIQGPIDGTVGEMLALLAGDYLTARINACQMLGQLGEWARPALPALRDAAQSGNRRLAEAADAAMTVIVNAGYRQARRSSACATIVAGPHYLDMLSPAC